MVLHRVQTQLLDLLLGQQYERKLLIAGEWLCMKTVIYKVSPCW
jgi:hypothetical protein